MNNQPSSSDSIIECDLLVLGGGPGGYSAAFRGADLGLSTVLVEREATLGGVCLNVGCIPSKALLHVATVSEAAQELAEHGVTFGERSLDLDKLRAWKASVVERLTGGLRGLARQRQVNVIHGTGKFLSERTLQVASAQGTERTVRFAHAIIAAGSEAVDPFEFLRKTNVEGAALFDKDPRIIDSTGALALRTLPERLLVIGGGVIGLELATVYAALGARVDVIEKSERLLTGADRDLVDVWSRRNAQRIRRISLNTVVVALREASGGIEVTTSPAQQETAIYDSILIAVGRTPNGNRVEAGKAGVLVSDRGSIAVDAQMRSNVKHIFAIGDLVSGPMLAHKASHQGHVAAEAAAGLASHFDARVIPEVAYTDPEIAWVGVTEELARHSGRAVRRAVFPWIASGRALASGRSEGFTKLLIDEATGRIVGGGIAGTHAGELVGELALAIEMGCHPTDLEKTIHPHPTLSESLSLAAAVHERVCTELPKA